MSLALPVSLTPSKISAFTDCALMFRYLVIDHLPEVQSPAATRGTVVHRALQLFFEQPPLARTQALLADCLVQAVAEEPDCPAEMAVEAENLLERYWRLEDPTAVEVVGTELRLEVSVDGLTVRGIIDRLERNPDGTLTVLDWKTGRAPSEKGERQRLGGVNFYAWLCERVLGERPSAVRLCYLADPVMLTSYPSDQSINAFERRMLAVWSAIERACERDAFKPHPSWKCSWCSYRDTHCPVFADRAPQVELAV